MLETFTAGARRVLDRARSRAMRRGAATIEMLDLLAALADEAESRAAELLAEHGLPPDRLLEALGLARTESDAGEEAREESGPELDALPEAPSLRAALGEAALKARALDRSRAVGTEHLLDALLESDRELAGRLERSGLDLAALQGRLQEG